jgi:hypothetical protein
LLRPQSSICSKRSSVAQDVLLNTLYWAIGHPLHNTTGPAFLLIFRNFCADGHFVDIGHWCCGHLYGRPTYLLHIVVFDSFYLSYNAQSKIRTKYFWVILIFNTNFCKFSVFHDNALMLHYENKTNNFIWKYFNLLHYNRCKSPTYFGHLFWLLVLFSL